MSGVSATVPNSGGKMEYGQSVLDPGDSIIGLTNSQFVSASRGSRFRVLFWDVCPTAQAWIGPFPRMKVLSILKPLMLLVST